MLSFLGAVSTDDLNDFTDIYREHCEVRERDNYLPVCTWYTILLGKLSDIHSAAPQTPTQPQVWLLMPFRSALSPHICVTHYTHSSRMRGPLLLASWLWLLLSEMPHRVLVSSYYMYLHHYIVFIGSNWF